MEHFKKLTLHRVFELLRGKPENEEVYMTSEVMATNETLCPLLLVVVENHLQQIGRPVEASGVEECVSATYTAGRASWHGVGSGRRGALCVTATHAC